MFPLVTSDCRVLVHRKKSGSDKVLMCMTSEPPESMWMDLDFLEMEMEASLIRTESLILELGEKE